MKLMRSNEAAALQQEHDAGRATGAWVSLSGSHRAMWRHSVQYLYIAIALPVAFLLCFLIPPLQSEDEGRHFLRACQIAQGDILPAIEPTTKNAGGWLPAAAPDFVRSRMTPEYFRQESQLHSVGDRLQALDRDAQTQAPLSRVRFASFPNATIYPPSLYLPQAAAIYLARLFSSKVYVWFYSGRLLNATAAVLLVFLALHLAPAYQFVLIIPAMLPISLYQISSLSTDAGFIALGILFVALCLRFLESDGALIRIALIACLFLLTTGKPVYLAFVLLLLTAHKRLGWRRAISFCSAAAAIAASGYLAWSYAVRDFIPLAGAGFAGHNPSAQAHFILAHPLGLVSVVLQTLKLDAHRLIIEVIGWFGWAELPLPAGFYKVTYGFFAALTFLIVLNWRRNDLSKFLFGSVTAIILLASIFLAGFILWTPVGAPQIWRITGRYLVPVLAILAFFLPPMNQLDSISKRILAALALVFFVFSTFTTVRIVKHYFFPEARLVGRNIRERFTEIPGRSCPATVSLEYNKWFSSIANGWAYVAGDFRVLLTDENGTILAESDSALAGADFPYNLLPASRSRWLVHIWTPTRIATLHYWLVAGGNACMFGSGLKLRPYDIPEA